jgi:hypothetical protein
MANCVAVSTNWIGRQPDKLIYHYVRVRVVDGPDRGAEGWLETGQVNGLLTPTSTPYQPSPTPVAHAYVVATPGLVVLGDDEIRDLQSAASPADRVARREGHAGVVRLAAGTRLDLIQGSPQRDVSDLLIRVPLGHQRSDLTLTWSRRAEGLIRCLRNWGGHALR